MVSDTFSLVKTQVPEELPENALKDLDELLNEFYVVPQPKQFFTHRGQSLKLARISDDAKVLEFDRVYSLVEAFVVKYNKYMSYTTDGLNSLITELYGKAEYVDREYFNDISDEFRPYAHLMYLRNTCLDDVTYACKFIEVICDGYFLGLTSETWDPILGKSNGEAANNTRIASNAEKFLITFYYFVDILEVIEAVDTHQVSPGCGG